MRTHKTFRLLLATSAMLLASCLLPCALLAGSRKNRVPKQPKSAHHPKPVRPRSNVHKVGRHDKHVGLSVVPGPPVPSAAITDDRTASRVHAWVKERNKHSATAADRAKDAGQRTSASTLSSIGKVSGPVSGPDGGPNGGPGGGPDGGPDGDELENAVTNNRQSPLFGGIAPEPTVLPTLYNRRGRLIVPPALKGSHEILIHQNEMADSEGLERVRDDNDLERMRVAGMLVALPMNATLRTDEHLPADRRYCRPWTALFLDTLARQHYAHFQTALQVNSAVRTVEFQQRLIHTNGNAAPADGDTASPHLTGQAIDIAKRGLSMAEIAWLRGYLLPLVQQGKVDVEEEFQQSCFHISVYRKYMPSPYANHRAIATTHREGIGALGMTLR